MSSVPFSHDTYNPTITHKTTQHDASPSSPTVHNTHDHQCTYLERRDGLVEVVALLVADVEPHQALRRIAGVGPWHLAAHHLDEARAFVGLAVDDVLVLLVGVRVVVVCGVEGSGFTNKTQGVRYGTWMRGQTGTTAPARMKDSPVRLPMGQYLRSTECGVL